MELKLVEHTGSFAENKNIARKLRTDVVIPALEKNKEITLNFTGVESATQSFIHALISDVLRKNGIDVLDRINFKGCNKTIKTLIRIVSEYMQDALEIEGRKEVRLKSEYKDKNRIQR
jgi:translation elongation factor EF-G